jgi:hypothetical protein
MEKRPMNHEFQHSFFNETLSLPGKVGVKPPIIRQDASPARAHAELSRAGSEVVYKNPGLLEVLTR